MGSWEPPEEAGIAGPPKPNAIIGHIVQRLFDIVQPPVVSLFLIIVVCHIY